MRSPKRLCTISRNVDWSWLTCDRICKFSPLEFIGTLFLRIHENINTWHPNGFNERICCQNSCYCWKDWPDTVPPDAILNFCWECMLVCYIYILWCPQSMTVSILMFSDWINNSMKNLFVLTKIISNEIYCYSFRLLCMLKPAKNNHYLALF